MDLNFDVISLDAFADGDTRDLAQHAVRIEQWPQDIVEVAQQVSSRYSIDGWILCGGMEHCGRIVDELNRIAPVLGPGRAQLRRLRSIRFWRELASGLVARERDRVVRICWPETAIARSEPRSGRWLSKPSRSAGGWLIHEDNQPADASTGHHRYWQRYVEGRSIGVTWIFREQSVHLLGVTESWSAVDWPGPTPFIYRGSWGPTQLSPLQLQVLDAFAQGCRRRLPDLRGWLQADFIEDAEGTLWLLELNPRWTAGMEVLHHTASSADHSPVAQHLRACGCDVDLPKTHKTATALFAKAILYADRRLEFTHADCAKMSLHRRWTAASTCNNHGDDHCNDHDHGDHDSVHWSHEWSLADLPTCDAGASLVIETGQPVATLRARVVSRPCNGEPPV